MQDVLLLYPEDVDVTVIDGRLDGFEILDPGWTKMGAAGWPTKGEPMPINITLMEDPTGNLAVKVWATKN